MGLLLGKAALPFHFASLLRRHSKKCEFAPEGRFAPFLEGPKIRNKVPNIVPFCKNCGKVTPSNKFNLFEYTVELQWLEHLLDSKDMFETGVVRANEC